MRYAYELSSAVVISELFLINVRDISNLYALQTTPS